MNSKETNFCIEADKLYDYVNQKGDGGLFVLAPNKSGAYIYFKGDARKLVITLVAAISSDSLLKDAMAIASKITNLKNHTPDPEFLLGMLSYLRKKAENNELPDDDDFLDKLLSILGVFNKN